ncbi:hypothetical protein ES703_81668 [subsurface metagenome]
MAGNTRGKLKEEFEGIHNSFEWAKKHCAKSLALIRQHNPNLTASVKLLAESVKTLDELAQDVYSKL